MARALGQSSPDRPRIQVLVERARSLTEQGKLDRAEEALLRAIRDAQGPCVACHRQLALTYQEAGRFKDAIAEWELVAVGSSNEEQVRQARAQIEALKKK